MFPKNLSSYEVLMNLIIPVISFLVIAIDALSTREYSKLLMLGFLRYHLGFSSVVLRSFFGTEEK